MSHWFNQMKSVKDKKYQEQINFLKENFGFSQVHANALVMHTRGSATSKRFATLDEYLKNTSQEQSKTIRNIFKTIKVNYPELKLVIAWNTPMLRYEDQYIFGVSAMKNHLLIAAWEDGILKKIAPKLKGYKVNKKTIQIPNDWKIDADLLYAIIKEGLKN